jgi:hypothetical protein
VAEKMIQLEKEKLTARSASICGVRFGDPRVSGHGRRPDRKSVNKHHLRSAAIGGHANGDERSNPKFDPVLEKGRRSWVAWFLCARRVFRK